MLDVFNSSCDNNEHKCFLFFLNWWFGKEFWKLFGNAMYDSDGVDLGEENADFEPLGQPYVECAFLETLDVNLW